ncbi:glycylpeptide N-tetradecanoyltransferase [Malassezia sp. CBS 17886]|nr:glycylpeptide N-tetradecanoyltransferase [Malassezia sp. CBS 17886]
MAPTRKERAEASATGHTTGSAEAAGADAAPPAGLRNLAKLMAMLPSDAAAAKRGGEHKFWKTQPVMQPEDNPQLAPGPIHANTPPEKVRAEPLPLPADFAWVTVDLDDAAQLQEVHDLLTANYVEDDDATMRFKYSAEFLHWALRHPGFDKSWHVGVRVVSTQKLVAFIAGIPHELRVGELSLHSTEINFLCVHKRLRSKRLAPVLIKEVTRRCNLAGVFQAIYTVGSVLPTPMSCARYYHRTLNAQKLLETGFSSVPLGMDRDAHIARFELPSATQLPGLREMTADDVAAVGHLLRRYLRRFDMAPQFTDEEVAHLFLSGRGQDTNGVPGRRGQVTWTYVVECDGRITDMASFYSLPSTVLDGSTEHSTLEAAYLFYYATDAAWAGADAGAPPVAPPPRTDLSPYAAAVNAGVPLWQRSALSRLTPAEAADEAGATSWREESLQTKARLKTRLTALMQDMLVLAKQSKFDVVNCLTVMDNALFAADLKFGPGDGFLRFYLFNWRTEPIPGGIGARADEQGLDPAAEMSPGPPSVYGAGNGIVMV